MILFFLACALDETSCTLIGCVNQLTLHLSYGDDTPVEGATGEVTVGDSTITFDCATTGADYTCTGNDVVLSFTGDGGAVSYEVHTPYYVGAEQDVTTIDWSTSQPNGPECDPTCYDGELDVMLFATP